MKSRFDAGFTLVEVLVAFAVAGLVAATILPALHMARSREGEARLRLEATAFGAATLEELALQPIDAPAEATGQSGRWRWRAELALEPVANARRQPLRLRHATIVVSDDRGRLQDVTLALDHLVAAR